MILAASQENIKRAADLLCQGDIVAVPTETVYGLAADATKEEAVRKIFKLKGRPDNNPIIVHIACFEKLAQVAEITKGSKVETRISKLKHFWPGPISLVVPRGRSIALSVTAGRPSVAVRIPNHEVTLKLLEVVGVPLAAPSANQSSCVSPTTAQHVYDSFGDKIPLILDGGPCRIGIESTVLDLQGEEVELLRPGGVSLEEIELALEERVAWRRCQEEVVIRAPGMLKKHYAPNTKFMLLDEIKTETLPPYVGYISFSPTKSLPLGFTPTATRVLSHSGKLEEIAEKLYTTLHELDALGLDLILVDSCEETGLGLAIMDRIRRATAKGD